MGKPSRYTPGERGSRALVPLEVRSQVGFSLTRDFVFTDLDRESSARRTTAEKRVVLGRNVVGVLVSQWSHGRPAKQADDLASATLERYLDLFVVPAG